MSFFHHNRRNEEEERITETEQYSTNYDRGYGQGGYNQGPREEERFSQNTYSGNIPPPPQVPYPWRPQWDDRERRYIFVNEQNGERTWEFPGRQGGNYGGEAYEQRAPPQQQKSGGHGMMYGALGAAAGLAGGALLMHEGDKIGDDFERDKDRLEGRFEEDKYRAENDVENFPDNAARWTGEKVGEVEDIPQDVEQGFDRFGNRIEGGFDRFGDKIEDGFQDVADAPEDVANWVSTSRVVTRWADEY